MVAYLDWKPKLWIAVVLGVLMQHVAFLYINRGWLFWVYFLLIAAVIVLLDLRLGTAYSLIFSLICPIHAFCLAKNYSLNVKRSWYSRWWGILLCFMGFFFCVFVTRSFLYEPFRFPSSSMEPTLNKGDHIVVKKYGYGTYGTFGFEIVSKKVEPEIMQRGKMYAFYPPNNNVPYVKRLIGKPGDTIFVKKDKIVVNDVSLETQLLSDAGDVLIYEQELDGSSFKIKRMLDRQAMTTSQVLIPENSYFFLGDNRENSADSRFWGMASGDKIVGKVIFSFTW